MSNTSRNLVRLVSGSVFDREEKAIEWLDRDTNPFGPDRPSFGPLVVVGARQPALREVRISIVDGATAPGIERPIDQECRILVRPDVYDDLVGRARIGASCFFVFVMSDPDNTLLVHVEKVQSDSPDYACLYKIVGENYYGARPAAMAFFWALSRVVNGLGGNLPELTGWTPEDVGEN